MEYKNDKIMDNISEISQIMQTYGNRFGYLTKTNSRLLLFFSLLIFLYGTLCDINFIYCPYCLHFSILGSSRNKTNGLKQCHYDNGDKPTQISLWQQIMQILRNVTFCSLTCGQHYFLNNLWGILQSKI